MNVVIRNSHNVVIGHQNKTFIDVSSKPMEWCHKQWRNLFSPLKNNSSSVKEVIKRTAIFVPLIFLSAFSYLIALTGKAFGCCFHCKKTNSNNNSINPILANDKVQEITKELENLEIQIVKVNSLAQLTINKGDKNSLQTKAPENYIEFLETTVVDKTLHLNVNANIDSPIHYNLTIPYSIKELEINGSSVAAVSNTDENSFICKINGSGTVEVEGKTDQQTIVIHGSGSYFAKNLESKETVLKLKGSGSAFINASEELDVEIEGSGTCHYTGNPKQRINISGSGILIKN